MELVLIVSSVLLWIALLFNLLLTLVLVRRVNASNPGPQRKTPDYGGPPVGQRAPSFTAETLDGVPVTLNSYVGHAVTFLFVTPECDPCREQLPSFEALRPAAAQAGVDLVLVSSGDAVPSRSFVDELHITLPVLIAPKQSNPFIDDYNITGTPSYCLIDAEGIVRSAGYPSPDWGEWKTLTESWTASQPQATAVALSGGGRAMT